MNSYVGMTMVKKEPMVISITKAYVLLTISNLHKSYNQWNHR